MIQALPNKTIVQFKPWRRKGLIDIPESACPGSVEAEVIDDGNKELPKGSQVIVSRMEGEYFEHEGTQYCTVPQSAVLMLRI